MRYFFTVLLLVLFVVFTKRAVACAVCGAADPTIPVVGAESAFKGRVRITTDARAASFRSNAISVDERRLELLPAWAPVSDLLLTAGIPIVWRSLFPTSSVGSSDVVLGDVELRATMNIWQSTFAPVRQRVGVFGGFRGPTAPLQKDAMGKPLPTDLQPGCGSIVTLAGAYWSIAHREWSLTTTASVFLPTPVRDGPHPGTSFRAGVVGQFQPSKWVGFRLGAHGRYDTSGAIGNLSDPASGGAVLYVVPELVFSPARDLVFAAGASFPAAQDLKGYRVIGPVALLSVSYDF